MKEKELSITPPENGLTKLLEESSKKLHDHLTEDVNPLKGFSDDAVNASNVTQSIKNIIIENTKPTK